MARTWEHEPEHRQDREPAKHEQREVTVDDPRLSAEANQRLTSEVREVIGAERVTVPNDRPRPSHGERQARRPAMAYVSGHWLQLAITFAAALVFGAILSLLTNSWWFLPLAAGIHALGTMAIAATAVRATTLSERPDPTTVALLEEEGVPNPERHFSSIVEEFTESRQHASTADVITPGGEERTVEADTDPATAAAEQSSAMTPSAGPSRPVGPGGDGRTSAHRGGGLVVAIVGLTALAVAGFCTLVALWLTQ